MWHMYIIEYFLAIINNEILSFKPVLELEDIMLSEISQAQNDKHCMFFHIWKLKFVLKGESSINISRT